MSAALVPHALLKAPPPGSCPHFATNPVLPVETGKLRASLGVCECPLRDARYNPLPAGKQRRGRHEMSIPPRPLEPKWAVIFTLAACPGGLVLVGLAHWLLYVPLPTALLWYALVAYLTISFSWSSLDWHSRRAAIKGNNAFVILAVCILVVVIIVQDEGQAFPMWATILLVAAGVLGYSVVGVCGVRNFVRWRRGTLAQAGNAAPDGRNERAVAQ